MLNDFYLDKNNIVWHEVLDNMVVVKGDDPAYCTEKAGIDKLCGPLIHCDERGQMIFDEIYWETAFNTMDCE